MAKIEDISAQSFQFTQGIAPSAPSSGKTKIYSKTDGKLYTQTNDGVEKVLSPDAANDKAQQALDTFPYVNMGNTVYGGTIVDNLDTLVKNGYYTCYGSSIGSPGSTTSWFVTHHNSNVGTVTATQKASSCVDTSIEYKRNKIGSTWQPWKRFPDTRYKGLRLARQIILTGTAATIEFNTDSDGNALNSTGGELLFYSGANSSIASVVSCNMQINGITTNSYSTGGGADVNYLNIGNVGNLASSKKTIISLINNNFFSETQIWYKYSSGGSSGSFISGMTTPQTAVNAIKLFLSAGTFPVGTVVEWWERG